MTDKPDGKRWGLTIASYGVALLAGYMGAYYALICEGINYGLWPVPRAVEYRCGSAIVGKMFAPAQWIDSHVIRRDYWAEEF